MNVPILLTKRELYKTNYVVLTESEYKVKDKIKKYSYISRVKHNKESDGVVMFIMNLKKDKMLVLEEFRYSINGYVINSPSGLIDEGEDILSACKREILEETGYSKCYLDYELKPSYSAVGISDEKTTSVVLRLDDTVNVGQKLGDSEYLNYMWIDKEEAKELLNKNNIASKTQLAMLLFINNSL